MLGELVRRQARQQHAADAQVDLGAAILGDQRIRRLLDPIVQESVGVLVSEHESGVDRFQQRGVERLLRFPVNQRQGGDLDDIAQAGELFQGFLAGGGEPLQLRGHEFHHVIGVVPGADAIDVPSPGRRDRVEREQPFIGQRHDELDREERIAAGLLLHELRQGPRSLRFAMQGIGDEPAHIVDSEGCQHDLLDSRLRPRGSPPASAGAGARGRSRDPGRPRPAAGAAPPSA